MADRHVAFLPLDDIAPATRNPKAHASAEIGRSIGHFGLAELPLIDDRTGRLVAGHGRISDLMARQRAGGDPPEGVRVDKDTGKWLVPVLRGWASRSDEDADAYLLASNRTTMLGGWDEAELAMMLGDLAAADGEMVLAAGFDEADLEAILATIDAPPFIHETVPASGATYAESAEDQADRETRIGAYGTRTVAAGGAGGGGTTEMVLVYPTDDRDEVGRLIGAVREVIDPELRAAEVILRALRTLCAVLDSRDDPRPIDCKNLAKHAGWKGEPA